MDRSATMDADDAMEMTGCYGKVFTAPSSTPGKQSVPTDDDCDMEMTGCFGKIIAKVPEPAASKDEEMEMTGCYGTIVKSTNITTATTSTVTSDDAPSAGEDMEMTGCFGTIIQRGSQLIDADMEMTSAVGRILQAQTRVPVAEERDEDKDDGQMEETACHGGILKAPGAIAIPSTLDDTSDGMEMTGCHGTVEFNSFIAQQMPQTPSTWVAEEKIDTPAAGIMDISKAAEEIANVAAIAEEFVAKAPASTRKLDTNKLLSEFEAMQPAVQSSVPTFEDIQRRINAEITASENAEEKRSAFDSEEQESVAQIDASTMNFEDEVEYTLNPKQAALVFQSKTPAKPIADADTTFSVLPDDTVNITRAHDLLSVSAITEFPPVVPPPLEADTTEYVENATFDISTKDSAENALNSTFDIASTVAPVQNEMPSTLVVDKDTASASVAAVPVRTRNIEPLHAVTQPAKISFADDVTEHLVTSTFASTFEAASSNPTPNVPLKEFLKTVQVRFLDKVSSGRRTTMLPPPPSVPETFADQLILGHVTLAELPLLEWACENLAELADFQKSEIAQREATVPFSSADLFEFATELADDSLLSSFQHSMATLKGNCRFAAKGQWHDFQFKLQTQIKEALDMEIAALASDVESVQADSGFLQSFNAAQRAATNEIATKHSHISMQIVDAAQINTFLSDKQKHDDSASLFADELAEFEAIKSQRVSLEARVSAAKSKLAQLLDEQKQCEESLLRASSSIGISDVESQQRKFDVLSAAQPWQLRHVSPAAVSLQFNQFAVEISLDSASSSTCPTIKLAQISCTTKSTNPFLAKVDISGLAEFTVGMPLNAAVEQLSAKLLSVSALATAMRHASVLHQVEVSVADGVSHISTRFVRSVCPIV